MVNEKGQFPEVCKKSIQAMVADMQGAVSPALFKQYSFDYLRGFTPRQLEACGRLTEPLISREGYNGYEAASWEEALDTLASKLKGSDPRETFFYFSGRSSNEPANCRDTRRAGW